ncbi:MAG: hypothetical protein QXM96_01275 [Candidatus Woesearchaeota archaeon]
MTELITFLSTGKGTWTEVIKLMSSYDWEKIIVITNQFGKENFKAKENMEVIVVNFDDTIENLIESLKKNLKDKITGTEVALNFISGQGKEHMALLSAVLKLGLGIRLVVFTNQVKEI